jgi:hypothetical protein
VSAYARHGIVVHEPYEFGSILRFTESVFGLLPMSASDSRAANLLRCFDFDQKPTPFEAIPSEYDARYFLRHKPSTRPPDDD